MKPLGDQNTHFWLAQRMAKTTNVDLVGAMAAADLTQADWAEMVHDCRDCDWTKGCKRWLATQQMSGADVPQDCPNKERFVALKMALEEQDL